MAAPAISRQRPTPRSVAWAVAALAVAAIVGIALGPVDLAPRRVVLEMLDRLPLITVDSGLSARQAAVLWELRIPRVVLGALVGGTLALAGATYQGVFRNPLADPYLLGIAAGAGFGATLAIVAGVTSSWVLPLAAFAGGLVAVVTTYGLGMIGGGGRHTTGTLILAGVAVASFFTALQTLAQQLSNDTIREVFAWILGRLTTVGWTEVWTLLPFLAVAGVAILVHGRHLDVLAVGEAEAASLGLPVERVRVVLIVAATLATAAAVSVSGLIGFVGIVVPHAVRRLAGTSYRALLPLSLLAGGAFLVAADIVARNVIAPSELPIGVVTAFVGAPFFAVVLRQTRKGLS